MLRAGCIRSARNRILAAARPGRARRIATWLAAAGWPLLFFWERVVPLRGGVLATGNDFIYLYYAYKAYLLDSLAHGTFPLWSPAESAGFPFYSNPFAQAVYPPNAALLLFRLAAGGYSSYDHQLFTLLGVSFFALGVYAWLRSLRLGVLPALFGACVVSISFRIADILRLPNAVHTAAWYPWILLALTRLAWARDGAERVRWTLLLVGCAIAFVTAGYPYYVYYSLFLFGPYLLLIPRLGATGEAGRVRYRAWLGSLAAAATLSLAICAPYLVKMKQLLDATRRTGDDPDYSLGFGFAWPDSVFSLVFPLAANADGCYYVGILPLLLIALYLRETWVDRSRAAPGRGGVCAVGGWVALVNYLTWGEQSVLFLSFRRWLPGFARLRAWGRLCVVLLPALAWLLALAFARLQQRLNALATGQGREARSAGPLLTLASSYALVCAAQLTILASGRVHHYYTDFMPELPSRARLTLLAGAVAFLALAGLIAAARSRRAAPRPPLVLALLLLVTVADLWPLASRLWSYRAPLATREPLGVPDVLRRSLSEPRHAGNGTISLDFAPDSPRLRLSPSFNVAVVPDWYFARYWALLDRHRSERDALERLLGLRDGRRLLLTARADHREVTAFLEDADGCDGSVSVRSYDGDRLELDVRTTAPGYLTFVDNWDPDWRGYVDGRPAPLLLSLGTFKAVAVPAGEHRVAFRYQPWSSRATAPAS